MTKVRDGLLLGKKTILKSDYLPACQNKSVTPQIESAPNYHQARSLHVHGVATPTAAGIQNLLDHIGAHKARKRVQVLWISLREEPVIYINGRPFVPRNVDNPFTNLDYTGINGLSVAQMEAHLKQDVLMEASRHGNKILVADELSDGEMVDQWETVATDSLKTVIEVYQELQAQGYLVQYERVPVTTQPKETDFDALIRKISQADIYTEIIFSCQMGCGNTTTGMVIATLLYFKRPGASDNSFGRIFTTGRNITYDLPNSEEDKIRSGEYAVVRSLIQALEGGVEGKRQVDKAIDRCASIQNLREAVPVYSSSILREPDEKKREAALPFFVEYLERYYLLICFSVYLDSEGAFLQTGSLNHVSFADWMQARPELYGILCRFLRRDPMGALAAMKPSLTKVAESTDGRPHEMSEVAALRSGVVLGSQTILKSDHIPGCRNASLRERVDGAPNFREVPGFAVYGVANPTVQGIRSVIERVWSLRGRRPVFWHNMREEPVIYINGIPFVVREVERPYKNMLEDKGTDRETVEGMEALLKEDILREAKRYDGEIMVIHETKDQNVFDCWEHAYSIQTPLEVFKSLEAEGFPVKYARVPVTDGKAPISSDFDTLTWNIASASKDTAFVFNCQTGRGQTTTGTVIACLVKLRMNRGRPIKVLTDSIVYDDSLSCEEGHGRAFGMDDIPLLWKVTSLFDNGVESREALDAVIDRCSAVQNIREAVLHYRKVFNQQHVEPRLRNAALKRSAEYLERYLWLITFAAYTGSENLDEACMKGGCKMTFKNWLHERPAVQAMKWSAREELQSLQGDAVMESIVSKRSGSVLCKGSILKMYFLPGQRTSGRLHIDEEGEDSVDSIGEQAVVYINGTPFVLRELRKPVDILKHVGIASPVVETRLKEDILSEVRETGGRMLLHREALNQSQVIGYWEYIQPEDVKTSAEVYAAQQRDALASNVNAIHDCKDDSLGYGENMDTISILPDDLILMIVRYLSAKEAARVSVLSKRFQKLFTIIQDPEFDENQEKLRGFLDRVSALPEMITRIRRFTLECKKRIDSADFALVNKCIRHVVKLGVMDFQMCLDGIEKGYSLPTELFTSKTLAKLTLGKGFEIEALPKDAFLPALQTLVLDSVRFYSLCGCAFQGLLSASPHLSELVISAMGENWEWSGVLSSRSLRRLSLVRVFSGEVDVPYHQKISFDTPSLEYLDYTDLVAYDYPSVNFQSLREAKLSLQMVANPQWDDAFRHDVDRYLSNPKKLINGLRNVRRLELCSSPTLEALNYFRRSIPILVHLHQLTITQEDIEYCWEFLPLLLEKSKNLKHLIIKGLHCAEEAGTSVCRCLGNYSCLLTSALEVVDVSLHDSTSRAERDQLEHFLGKLSRLQLLRVTCRGKISEEGKIEMARELHQLPKASSKCRIVCV